jgi:hypothetical protein
MQLSVDKLIIIRSELMFARAIPIAWHPSKDLFEIPLGNLVLPLTTIRIGADSDADTDAPLAVTA